MYIFLQDLFCLNLPMVAILIIDVTFQLILVWLITSLAKNLWCFFCNFLVCMKFLCFIFFVSTVLALTNYIVVSDYVAYFSSFLWCLGHSWPPALFVLHSQRSPKSQRSWWGHNNEVRCKLKGGWKWVFRKVEHLLKESKDTYRRKLYRLLERNPYRDPEDSGPSTFAAVPVLPVFHVEYCCYCCSSWLWSKGHQQTRQTQAEYVVVFTLTNVEALMDRMLAIMDNPSHQQCKQSEKHCTIVFLYIYVYCCV